MEVHFSTETEQRLQYLALHNGRSTPDQLVRDVVDGYFEELKQAQDMLSSRYDDLKSGSVQPIPGDEIEAYFKAKSAAALRRRSGL